MSIALQAQDLSFSYNGRTTIDSVSLDLEAGTLTALVGPNGAGKSTLLHLLQGRLKASRGSLKCSTSIGMMPQRSSIDWSFPITARQMVSLGKISGQQRRRHTADADADALLSLVGMDVAGEQRLDRLSGGQQQRVLLARALMQKTGILLLDEPCSAIDPPTREHLLGVMKAQAESGQTLLVTSHDWGSALDSYDRVIVLDGKVLASGTPETVRATLTDMTCMMGSHCCD